jgi:streptomycin 3"-adenylyltransferase
LNTKVDCPLLLNEIVNSYSTILKDNLVGIYLHGSLAMNCFNPLVSDIDFIVVVKSKLLFEDMRKLINVLLELSDVGPQNGFEMSVLLEKDTIVNFKYPTPFILHYSDMYKDKYMNDANYICGGFEDTDLAVHFVIIRERGIALIGKPINEVFQKIPQKYYIASIMNDIIDARVKIINNPVYNTLNLCRVLCFLEEGKICSKKEGGEWAKAKLPVDYKI